MRSILLSVVLFLSAATAAPGTPLQIYFLDVEGGKATLVVSPSGESLLIDTGWPGFGGGDADRNLDRLVRNARSIKVAVNSCLLSESPNRSTDVRR
ncbi:MAG: hypothetical protein ACE145_10445 [Terriglobia bacterium]